MMFQMFSEIYHEEYNCVRYYCMTLLGSTLSPLDPFDTSQYDATYFKQTQALANKYCRSCKATEYYLHCASSHTIHGHNVLFFTTQFIACILKE